MTNLFGFNFYLNLYYREVFNQKIFKQSWFKDHEEIVQSVFKSIILYANRKCNVCYVCARLMEENHRMDNVDLSESNLMVIECINYPEAYSPYDVEAMVSDRVIVNALYSAFSEKPKENDNARNTAYAELIEEGLIGQPASGAGREYKF